MSNGVTQEDRVSAALVVRVQSVRGVVRQILTTVTSSCDGEGILVPKFLISHCLEKLLARIRVPVPQTDTGRRGENPKVIERTLVKELGKMTP